MRLLSRTFLRTCTTDQTAAEQLSIPLDQLPCYWSSESYFLVILSLITVGYDLYFVSFWNTSFWWHQNHVFAHCTFLISEYAACGYLAFKVELDTIGVESLLTFLVALQPFVHSLRLFFLTNFPGATFIPFLFFWTLEYLGDIYMPKCYVDVGSISSHSRALTFSHFACHP